MKVLLAFRNRLLRGKGRSFQVIEAPRGASLRGRRIHRNSAIEHFPKLLELCNFHGKSPMSEKNSFPVFSKKGERG